MTQNYEHSPAAKTITIGGYQIACLSDGLVDVPLSGYQDINNAEGIETVEHAILKGHQVQVDASGNFLVPLNAFLIQHDGNNILVDTGAGGQLPPQQDNGVLLASLATGRYTGGGDRFQAPGCCG